MLDPDEKAASGKSFAARAVFVVGPDKTLKLSILCEPQTMLLHKYCCFVCECSAVGAVPALAQGQLCIWWNGIETIWLAGGTLCALQCMHLQRRASAARLPPSDQMTQHTGRAHCQSAQRTVQRGGALLPALLLACLCRPVFHRAQL